jgi:hypothetical protein
MVKQPKINVWGEADRACGGGRMRLHFSLSSTTLDTLTTGIKVSAGNSRNGAVAQSVERSPEKAGVGGSIPPCPTCPSRRS